MKRELSNGDIAIDQLGAVGIIGEIDSSVAQFFAFDADGKTAGSERITIESLVRARLAQIPASRRADLTDEQWADLGYTDAAVQTPAPAPAPAPAPVEGA